VTEIGQGTLERASGGWLAPSPHTAVERHSRGRDECHHVARRPGPRARSHDDTPDGPLIWQRRTQRTRASSASLPADRVRGRSSGDADRKRPHLRRRLRVQDRTRRILTREASR